MPSNARVVIGQVQGTHGLHGEIRIRPLTDFPERFFDIQNLSFYRDGKHVGNYRVKAMRDTVNRGCFLAMLEGVETIEQAGLLCGCSMEINTEERMPLPPGEFWINDLIGLDTCDDQGRSLGTVKDIVDSGASRLVIVRDPDGRDHKIPAAPEFLRSVDLEERRLTLHLIEGLWEL